MLTAAVVIVFHALGAVSAVHAVMSRRTSQGAIAWAVSLVTFPYLAVPAYWVLGRSKFQGYVMARRDTDVRNEYIEQEAIENAMRFRIPEADRREAARVAEALAGMPALGGNQAELLIDGDATFTSILEGIDQAQDYVLFQFFIVKDDGLGRKVKEHLIVKAKEGVRVYFIYDEIGSHALPGSSRAYLDCQPLLRA